MSKGEFGQLDPVAFLQTFASQSAKIGGGAGCSNCSSPRNHIEKVGLSASRHFEEEYRAHHGITDELNEEQYTDLIIGLKNRIGGNFSMTSSRSGTVRVVNSRCPFGKAVREAPNLCHMTSSVFGGIAARNFGYAKVVLDRRIADGDSKCQVTICLDPRDNAGRGGVEYKFDEGKVVGSVPPAEIASRIEDRMYQAWRRNVGKRRHKHGERPHLVASSPAMLRALEIAEVVGPTMATVLVTGETGVGKEVIARAVHAISERWDKRFEAVNCGAIPENLIESALFGHEKGAFTGAYEVHHGLFERADGGTLFLDEIDSLPLAVQVQLLRVLQDGEFRRVGGKHAMQSDVRVIAASGRPLDALVADGAFREDLFYRLNVVPIYIPPLRDRSEELEDFVEYFLQRLSARYGKPLKGVSREVMQSIYAHDWPGNVRELENTLERSFLFCKGTILESLMFDD
ncbi:MAG: sigma 54-interacting transcriptional regulator, partial [Pseudomonadota bacterium]